MKTLLLFLTLLLLINGCSTREIPHKRNNSIKISLLEAYKKWKNTPYCYGGHSKSGVDCSSLVQILYKNAFNISLPRTTQAQVLMGHKISKYKMREGDLIFFKTGTRSHHSGVYLENGKFIHSSSTKGVTISNLNNPYWRSKYWQSRRILTHD
ncbi:C40 family peptidase [Sulfurimonas sp.]